MRAGARRPTFRGSRPRRWTFRSAWTAECATRFQRITQKKDVTVFFRVADVYRDVTLKVLDGDRVVLRKKKPKMAPGEMESVTLKPEQLDGAAGLRFELEVG